ncbi:photosynthetic NDH subunit of subcomplex B 2, chloroplastic [Impatiens glandulifera]|uniref:photosynthetic NDH subunit of subcomplex B 2, chloroplastic n=1 Tax=Impatiens glandulifera TaxID=253017 RepID=UPI001FB1379C|nr:photosynthetic NDH subunit of subcomplex B 2, chloroplastic [Impatiens glandulifera]
MASLVSSSTFITLPKPLRLTQRTHFSPPSATLSSAPPVEAPLDQKYGRKGIKFTDNGDEVELTVRNGSSLKVRIADAHVVSYKPKVYWKDDGFEEVLYTLDSPEAKSRGGIGLIVNQVSSEPIKTPSSSDWTVKDVDSDAIDALQVELGCTKGSLEMSYVVSLYPLSMASAVIVKNNGVKAVSLTTAILSHYRFKKRGGTAIQGLKGCSYCSHPPLSSPFEILSPFEAMKTEDPSWFSFGWEPEKKQGEWSIQDVPITILKNKLSRLYGSPPDERRNLFHNSAAPSKYETIDQGRELFFRMIRIGFDEIYVSSPGSFAEKYGKDYFICSGPASMMVPIELKPGEEWKGAQIIQHDNL